MIAVQCDVVAHRPQIVVWDRDQLPVPVDPVGIERQPETAAHADRDRRRLHHLPEFVAPFPRHTVRFQYPVDCQHSYDSFLFCSY